MNGNKVIVVLGMHRSGTSALTGALNLLGAETGSRLVPEERSNPKGHWEHADIVEIQQSLLEEFDSTWDDIAPLPEAWWKTPTALSCGEQIRSVLQRDFDKVPMSVVKDPRTSLLLPLWLNAFSRLGWEPYFILSLRHPLEVAESLQKRDQIGEERSCLIWLNYVLSSEYWTRGRDRLLIPYAELLEDWRGVARTIAGKFSLPLVYASASAQQKVDDFLEPSLRHSAMPKEPKACGQSCELAQRVYQLLCKAGRDAVAEDELDAIRREFSELVEMFRPWERELRLWQRKAIQEEKRRVEQLDRIRNHVVLGRVIRLWGRVVNSAFRDFG